MNNKDDHDDNIDFDAVYCGGEPNPALIPRSVKKLRVQDGVTEIPGGAFSGYTELDTVYIPPSCAKIGFRAFVHCPRLATVVFLNGPKGQASPITCLEACTFGFGWRGEVAGTTPAKMNLVNFETLSSIYCIAPAAFAGCGMESITLPPNVELVQDRAFGDCAWLKKIMFPANLDQLHPNALEGCSALEHIVIPAGNQKRWSFGEIFQNRPSLKIVEFAVPDGWVGRQGITQKDQFAGSHNIESLVVPRTKGGLSMSLWPLLFHCFGSPRGICGSAGIDRPEQRCQIQANFLFEFLTNDMESASLCPHLAQSVSQKHGSKYDGVNRKRKSMGLGAQSRKKIKTMLDAMCQSMSAVRRYMDAKRTALEEMVGKLGGNASDS